MQSEWTIAEIAPALGVCPRTAQNRAKSERWPTVASPVRGRRRICYPGDLLPEDVRLALARWCLKSEGEVAGFSSGCRAARESEEAKRMAMETGLAGFSTLPKHRQDEAMARLEILKARDNFLAASGLPKKRGSQTFCREVKAGTIRLPSWVIDAAATRSGRVSVSWPSLLRWESAYESGGLANLASQYARPSVNSDSETQGYVMPVSTTVPDHMRRLIVGLLVDHPHINVPKIRAGLEARYPGQDTPHQASIRRFVNAWKEANKSLFLYLTNPDEWRNRHMFAMGSASERAVRLNQIWEMDSTPGDVMLTDGRHTVIGVIDVYSRRMKLLVSPTSKAESVAALLRRALLDWGVPEIVKTDNGADYVSRHVVRVLESLEIWQELCPPFTPESKPHIERALGTFSHDIVELLPGYIGHCVADRKAIEARRSFAKRLMDQGSNPVEVKMTASEFQALCDDWIEAIYHQNPHSGLDGMRPAEKAREWGEPDKRIRNERALDMLLLPAASNGGYRTIGKEGIEVDGGHYIAGEFANKEGQRVFVLVDRTDFGRVYVFYAEGFLCTAVDPARAGLDRAEMSARAKAVQRRAMQVGSAAVKRDAREMKTRFIHQEILEHRKRQLENVTEMPRDSVEYTTDALEEAARAADDFLRREMGPQPIDISEEEDASAREVIRLAEKRSIAGLPSTDMEVYDALVAERNQGAALTVNEENWLADYDHYLLTGEKRGLHAAGFQPFAERKVEDGRRKAEGER